MFMPENYINVLFSKGLVLDDIIKLLNIEKINLCKQKNEFVNVIGSSEPIEVKVTPLYVLTDSKGKEYYI